MYICDILLNLSIINTLDLSKTYERDTALFYLFSHGKVNVSFWAINKHVK